MLIRPAGAGALYLAMVMLFAVGQLLPAQAPVVSAAVVATVAFPLGLARASRPARRISLTLAVAGLVLSLRCRMAPADYLRGLTGMLGVLGIVVAAQVLTIPVRLGDYVGALLTGVDRAARGNKSTLLVQMGSFLVGAFMLVGAIPAVFYALWPGAAEEVSSRREEARRLLLPIVRGSGAAIVWTPAAGTVAVATAAARVPVTHYLLYALPLAVLVALALTPREPALDMGAAPAPVGRERSEKGRGVTGGTGDLAHGHGQTDFFGRKRAELALAFGALLSAIAVGDLLLRNRDQICFIAAAIATCGLAWAYLLDARRCLAALRDLPTKVSSLSDNVVTFVAAGFFAAAAARSGAVGAVARFIPTIARWGLALPAVSGCVFALAFAGIHPTVSISIIGPAAMAAGTTRGDLLALSLVCSAALAYIASPFSATSLLTASLARRPVVDVSVGWNLRSILTVWCSVLAVLSVLALLTAG